MNDYKPVALMPHIMKTLERLLLHHIRPQVAQEQEPLQFAYLDVPDSYVRVMFFDFSSAFNTIQPPILRGKLRGMGVAPSLTSWIMDYLIATTQFVRFWLRSCSGCTHVTLNTLSPATFRSIQMIQLLDRRGSTGTWRRPSVTGEIRPAASWASPRLRRWW